MSGLPTPLRSPWFGDALTSATTQESGRNWDTSSTIGGSPICFDGPAWRNAKQKTPKADNQRLPIVQKRVATTSWNLRAWPERGEIPAACCGAASTPVDMWITFSSFRLYPVCGPDPRASVGGQTKDDRPDRSQADPDGHSRGRWMRPHYTTHNATVSGSGSPVPGRAAGPDRWSAPGAMPRA